jgi:hypothetical protein
MTRILKFFLVYIILLTIFSCNQAPPVQQQPDRDSVLSVYFFHLTARCDACTAIEENTKAVLDKFYKSQIENGTITFKSINIDKRENKVIVKKYQVSFTSLLLVRADGTFTDFTNTSLNYAFMNPAMFRELLKEEIDKNIN